MPRRNNNSRLVILDENSIDFTEQIRPVKDFLKNTFYDLLKEKGEKIECPICMEEINCKKCFTLLSCGHYLHLDELLKCKSCPVCRG